MPIDDDVFTRLAFERAGAALSLTDPGGRLLHANQSFRELFGWSPEDDIDISAITRPEDQEWTQTYIRRIIGGDDDEFHSVKRFVRRDGSEFSGAVTIRPLLHGGRCVGIVGVVTPTESREIVDDPRVGKLLEHSASTITLIDAVGNVLETAGRYRATLGYPKEFWEERTIFDILTPESAERVTSIRDEVLAAPDSVFSDDFTVLDAAGTHHVLEVTAVNLLSDPDIAGIVITSRNVTDERANRAELTALRDEAVAVADQRSRLVATVSHELRNPLHAVTGLSELLVSDPALPTSLRDLASTLHRQVEQLKRVTDDLLDAAQLEIGDASLRAGPTRVRRIVEDVARLGRAAQGDKPVAVWASVDEHVPAVVHTDAGRLHQLLLNLVGNAVKFTDAGEVGISVTATELDDELQLQIAVRDTGRGIPADDLDRIFEPFLMAGTAGDQGGAGLGLAVASRIVDRLGGSITVESEVGRGTTFDISFPVGVSDEPIEVARPDLTKSTDRPTILVVEDNAVNQELARHQLARLGAVGVVVATAEEAIELAVDGEFDAILMDHQLPGMNGRDATRELRRLSVTTPIIGMTASATAADEQACLDAGMDAFLAKPVGLEQLGAALAAHVAHEHPDTATSEHGDLDADADAAVDLATLRTLADELGDPAIVEALVTTFLDELERRQAAIVGGDPELVAREAHTLKSSARLLGAFQLATVCEQVETDPSRAPLVDDHATAAARAFRSWLRDRPQEETQ